MENPEATPLKKRAPPPPPPTKKMLRPKITIQIPDTPSAMPKGPQTAASIYWVPPKFSNMAPGTPASHTSGPQVNPYFNPFMHMYHNKASDFMFKQFEGFKDFTMNTAKSGLSAGEKSAFWFVNKLRVLSKKWFTHIFLVGCLVLYSVLGALMFMALEGPVEDKLDRNLTTIRRNFGESILQDIKSNEYRIFTSRLGKLGVMSKEQSGQKYPFSLKIPIIKADSETQTSGRPVAVSQDKKIIDEMDLPQNLRKRRTLSKNRGQARQREKTPEPGRTPIPHEDITTSDDEDCRPQQRSSREIEADKTYEEMKRLVQEQSGAKDPVYDLDIDEVMEARAREVSERRRRSISPFAIPDKEELCKLQRKGSFIDPTNKLLSTTYTLSPKEDDPVRRSSLTIETAPERRNSLTLPTPPLNSSPTKDKPDFPYPIPTTPKKLEEMKYQDEDNNLATKPQSSPVRKENIFSFSEKDVKPKTPKAATPKPEPGPPPGELVTKVIQIERTPSKKLTDENKPTVEVRQRVVRTPSRKSIAEGKPLVMRQSLKDTKPDTAPKVPPVKPARSRSASKPGGKTSESEMSEDQIRQQNANPILAPRRKVVPTPRRFIKNRSPRANRSQSVNRIEDIVVDKSGAGLTQTSRDIIELMQQARARSLSIPKDDPRLPNPYKSYSKTLVTPNKTPVSVSRQTRGISCPKTIQIISQKEILQGLSTNNRIALEKTSRQSSGYVDASQSEYTSSCYSSSPSDNEHNFDLAEKTDELTKKLNKLSQEVEERDIHSNIILSNDFPEPKSVLRKRHVHSSKDNKAIAKEPLVKPEIKELKKKPVTQSRFTLIANWRHFVAENKTYYNSLKLQRNRCICEFLLMFFYCGLGGMMFKTLEGSFENVYKCSTRNVKRDFIEALWKGSHYLREEDWKSMARKKLFEFEDQLHTAHEAGVTSYSGQRSWNFMNSFVYCLTLITTIGYGHIAPKTMYGRVATIVYAIIGIPLFLIVLADFGKLFTRIIKFFWAFIRRFYYTRSCKKVRRTVPVQEVMKGLNIVYDVVRRPSQIFSEDEMAENRGEGDAPPPIQRKPSEVPPPLPPKPGTVIQEDTEPGTPAPSVFEIDDEFNLPISVAIVILVIYIIIGAAGYSIWETWSFFESFYFVFISMSTIGLGDLVPDHPMFMMASILYLVFGLALTSMCINVVQTKLTDSFKQASAKIGATIGLRVAEEDGSLVPVTPPPTEIAPVHIPKKAAEVENNSKNENEDDNDR